jgi:hypothetical protein
MNRLFPLLALLWLALLLPGLDVRYSFGWDSSQFDRAVSDFDIARHQPHPPGYPLWVLALRGLTPLAGNPNRAQVLLALLFTIAGLWFFRSLAQRLLGNRAGQGATVLLAFSPLVCLCASSSQIYAVDLFSSCFAGWLAAEFWSGRTNRALPGLVVLALAAGFRPSGVVFLLPLLCLALWGSGLKKPVQVAAGVIAGAACWLAWFVPTALLTGGFSALSALNQTQLASSFQKTSVFYGASVSAHFHMVIEVCFFFAMALAGFALPLTASLFTRFKGIAALPAWAPPAFFILWLAPNLALVFLFHCGNPGYVLLSLPPLALLLSWVAAHSLNNLGWTAAGLAAALLVGNFPYERYVKPDVTTLQFHLLRTTPRIAGMVEAAQRELETLIRSMPGGPEEKLLLCFCRRFEAPNIRTVTYDFAEVYWAQIEGPELRFFPPRDGSPSSKPPASIRSIAVVCAASELPSAIRDRFPGLRKIAGNNLYSLWADPASTPLEAGILQKLLPSAGVTPP